MSNFDVVNDTAGPCHGFEIELEDITDTDVRYTFGGPASTCAAGIEPGAVVNIALLVRAVGNALDGCPLL